MVAFHFDGSQYEPTLGGASALPENWYNAVINKTEFKKVRDPNSKNQYLEVSMYLPQMGTSYIERYNLINDSADAARIAGQAFAFLRGCLRLSPQMQDTNDLHNIPFQVFLRVEEGEVNGRKITQNRIGNLRFADGTDYKPGKVPPPNPAAQNPSQAAHYGGQPQAGAPAGFTQPGQPQAQPQGQPQAGYPPQPGPQAGFPQPGPQAGFPQPGQPAAPPQGGGFPQPGQPAAQGFPQPGQPAGQPQGQPQGFPQAQGGFPQPGQPQAQPQAGFPQPGQPQAGFPQAQGGFPQPGQPQPGFPQPNGGFPQPQG